MDKRKAIEEAVRLYLDGPRSLLWETPADRAMARARELGATQEEINAEEVRQRCERGM
jgi:hypothetical protein